MMCSHMRPPPLPRRQTVTTYQVGHTHCPGGTPYDCNIYPKNKTATNSYRAHCIAGGSGDPVYHRDPDNKSRD